MVEGPGKGQLKAWQDLGKGQGPRPGSDFGRFWSILTIFETLSRIRKFWSGLRDLSKRRLYARGFWSESGREGNFGVKNLTEVSSLGGQFWPFWAILGDFGHFWTILGRSGVREGSDDGRGTLQRAAEGLAGAGERSGTEVGEGLGRLLAILGPRGQNLRVRGQNLGSGVKI